MVNEQDIKQVIHMGYIDEDEVKFKIDIKKRMR